MLMIRRVVGDSMLPSLRPSQLVVAHRFYRRLRPGNVVIVRHRGMEKIKRIDHVESQGIYVLGDNALESTDSRDFGLLPRSCVAAKVVWPLLRTN